MNHILRKIMAVQLALLLGAASLAHAQTAVNSARVWPAPDHTRLVLDLGSSVEHSVFALENPSRLVIDIKDTSLKVALDRLDLDGSPIKRIRSARRNGNDLRVVLDLASDVKPRSFQLAPNQEYGHRLVVDLINENAPAQKPSSKPVLSESNDSKRDIIVMIDAGHGGEDPGASGPGGTREKDVVLKLAHQLKDAISSIPGYTAKLTRDGDYYIDLRSRTLLARKENADLFISVHADAFRTSQPRGASVFALSQRGATSETARWLARNENRSDLIGGVGGVSLGDKNEVLAGVLLDLSMTASINASVGVGSYVLRNLGSVATLHKPGVEQAAFVVLKSPDIPSILVEAGFISNPQEERKLLSASYRSKLAHAISRGVQSYFNDTPPPGTYLAWQKRQGKSAGGLSSYRVQRGDTLSDLARRNATTVSRIKQLNGLKGDQVVIGQTIKIPTT
ncbi:N-acetylmuramoyl-L-alanine amidase [Marinobacter sp. BGYM27]|uniref:N-acetylmuramoyl-L-alanine amidase n=1 Tax=Marinobacter sp. BGYM27 TaxID=2975597 RepID=UPI0021A76A9B|nr:N-acetylmuramoyl-L-alanine amidase [Marinobacter sp. BGYM27]MDG5499316.1 N-acetylmuramoyl-L-alanine amidase [Marinobacter sp. BGYM27]